MGCYSRPPLKEVLSSKLMMQKKCVACCGMDLIKMTVCLCNYILI